MPLFSAAMPLPLAPHALRFARATRAATPFHFSPLLPIFIDAVPDIDIMLFRHDRLLSPAAISLIRHAAFTLDAAITPFRPIIISPLHYAIFRFSFTLFAITPFSR
jgi:hypothetical protein